MTDLPESSRNTEAAEHTALPLHLRCQQHLLDPHPHRVGAPEDTVRKDKPLWLRGQEVIREAEGTLARVFLNRSH